LISSISAFILKISPNAFEASSITVAPSINAEANSYHSLFAEIFPVDGLLCPAIILRSVDFPAPFLPIRAILSFSLIAKETSLKKYSQTVLKYR
jgi:hypothetical protein